MKGMRSSIDILWLAEAEGGGRVVHVERQLPPCEKDPCPAYQPMRKAAYVVEMNAGQAKKHGVQGGAVLRFTLPAAR